jgi:PAS domain S-box-containing protein
MSKPRILIVEDEVIVARDIRQQLVHLGYKPLADTARGEEAVTLAEQLRPNLVLMDIHLAGKMDGIAAAQTIREQFALPVVFLTAFASNDMLDRAKLAEPFGYIIKPFDERELRTVIEMALYKHGAEMRLHQSYVEQDAILRTALDGFWLVDRRGRILEANEACGQIYGYTREEMLGKSIGDFETEYSPKEIGAMMEHIRKDGSARFEGRHRRKDGPPIDVEISVNYLPHSGGRFFAFIRNITERQRVQAEREKLVRLIEHSGDYIAMADLDGRLTYINAAGRGMIGFSEGQDPGTLHINDAVAPGWIEFFRHTVIPTTRERGLWEGEMQLRNLQTGELIDVFRSTFLIRDPHTATPLCLATVTRDITERKRLERQLLETSERERQQLGSDLHDGLGQQLHGIHLLSTLLEKNLHTDESPRTADAARLNKFLVEAHEMARGLARGLQPVIPEPEGLMAALRELTAQTRELYHIDCRLLCQRPVLVAAPFVASHLYRIAQEAVNNAVKHARPTRIRIAIHANRGRIVLGVSDNGIGLRATRRQREGMGLRIMHHRAAVISGTLTVTCPSRGGTKVVCSIPQTVKSETLHSAAIE